MDGDVPFLGPYPLSGVSHYRVSSLLLIPFLTTVSILQVAKAKRAVVSVLYPHLTGLIHTNFIFPTSKKIKCGL